MSDTPQSDYPQNPAPTALDILDVIQKRWSPRAYDSRPIDPQDIRRLFEAARWAASSFNRQPWNFIIAPITEPDVHQRMLHVLNEGNQTWAQHAPLIGLAVATLEDQYGENRHARHDTGMALAHMALQAVDMGMFLHMIAGFSVERAREMYHIPPTHDPLTMFTVGYPGKIDDLPEKIQKKDRKPRTRNDLSEIVFMRDWEQPADIVESDGDS
jgi:nitroreductase